MFGYIQALVLGLIQGATEFLPVSSSGHLTIAPWLLGWPNSSLLFDTVVHWGTLLAILVVFWRDFLRIAQATLISLLRRSLDDVHARLGWFIVLGSIPAAVTGLLFKDFFEQLFASPPAAGGFLLVTALLLWGSEWLGRREGLHKNMEAITFWDAVVIGLAQAIALAPGISRSGSTMAAGLARGVQRETAARYSFLLGAPAFLGAGLLQLSDALAVDPATVASQAPLLFVGFAASALSGFVAIRFLLAYLRQRTLTIFALYCAGVGVLVLLLSIFSLR